MKIVDIISESQNPVFSFEILPPLKGNSVLKVFDIIEKLRQFDPKFVNITSHHSEYIFKPLPDGTHKRVSIVKRPGTVAIAAAIQHRYGLIPVPHIICKGFTKEETEYALLDLNFLGINNLMLLRGDVKGLDVNSDEGLYNQYATDLQRQVNLFNEGIGLEDTRIDGIQTPFSYGMACYPEKHEEAPNMDSDLRYAKQKVDNGADYLITQMFFDNQKYFDFVDRCRREGINVPILPGLKPISKKSQLSVLPKVFRTDIPEELAERVREATSDAEVRQAGIDWGIRQARELLEKGAPGIHFYTMSVADSVQKLHHVYSDLKEILRNHVLVLDGAMGTMIQRLPLTENDFRGVVLKGHPVRLAGCNDLLSLTKPEAISGIHCEYIEAGADIISTNSFNANAVSLEDYDLHHDEGFIRKLNHAAASLALDAAIKSPARAWGGRALVAGSVGPTNRTASMSPDVADPSARNVDYDRLFEAYSTQIEGLIEGGVDIILFETVFDTLNLKAGLDAASRVMEKSGFEIPIMISATVSDKAGRTLSGQTIKAFVTSVEEYDHVMSLGLNCGFGPAGVYPYIKELSETTSLLVSCHPNAGLPNALGEYDETPEKFARHMSRILDAGLVNIAGGCCGTTPAHISALRGLADKALPHIPDHKEKALRVSGLELLEILPQNNFVNVGERCNVAGSRKFLRLIKEKKYDEALSIAARQVSDGAMMIDVNMDDALLDAREEMVHFMRCVASDPDVAKVPVMVDSSDWDVIEAALKNLQGKSIVNSISLKEGEEKFIRHACRLRGLGAAVIVMAFDEKGQADTFERKIEVCQRAYRLLTEKCRFRPEDIIFDVNVMAVATGMEEHRFYGLDFIKAVGWVKKNLPGAKTSGGISNLSFAFRGKNYLREAMHAVFLYHAIKAGLDMGIVNPASSVTYEEIDPRLRELIEDVILARRAEACDELAEYAANDVASSAKVETADERDISIPVGKRLSEAIVKGKADFLAEDLDEALEKIGAPVDIIEGPLMEGMNLVGRLFGEGKMFLPQVVKTARTMKIAVDYLRPLMEQEKAQGAKAGKVVFATVKGDVHDIGKNIVSIVLACNNYEVVDLGVMVPAEKIVATVLEERPDLVCLSGLITPSLTEMVNVAKALDEAGLDIPILVGGATTSRVHTALKIAPVYKGVVVHASDAAQEPLIASRLLGETTREQYVECLEREYEDIRERYAETRQELVSLDEARSKRNAGDAEYKKTVPAIATEGFKIIDLDPALISAYINWKMFFHAWRIPGDYLEGFPYDGCQHCVVSWLQGVKHKSKAKVALKLYQDACRLLSELGSSIKFDGKAIVGFKEACSVGDNLLIGGETIPLLRQQKAGSSYKCLSDYVATAESGGDYVGLFAVSIGRAMAREAAECKEKDDDYRALLLQTVADRLAEAASEWLHSEVRKNFWGYAPDECLSPAEMLQGKFEGIRPAVGYPMLPDQLLNHTLARLIPLKEIGIDLTENGAMTPSSSVSGLYIANPKATYFMVGRIGDDQIEDYAGRRGLDPERIREILRI